VKTDITAIVVVYSVRELSTRLGGLRVGGLVDGLGFTMRRSHGFDDAGWMPRPMMHSIVLLGDCFGRRSPQDFKKSKKTYPKGLTIPKF